MPARIHQKVCPELNISGYKKSILGIYSVLVIITIASAYSSASAQSARPNIVFIVSDDHGREAVGCYGNKVIKTPGIDSLAKEGIRFTHAFATVASCSPSRSVLLTGLYSHSNAMYGLEHREHHFSVYNHLQSAACIACESRVPDSPHRQVSCRTRTGIPFSTGMKDETTDDPASIGRNPVEMADSCRHFIEEPSDQPFFLYFATDDPHRGSASLPDGSPDFGGRVPNPFGNTAKGYPGIKEIKYKPGEVLVPSLLTRYEGYPGRTGAVLSINQPA